MKITYALTTADMGAGTERTIFTQANWMSTRANVDILSVYRTAEHTHFDADDRVSVHHIGTLPELRQPSRLIPASWDSQYDASIDTQLERTFRALDTDVIVTTTPVLAYLAARFCQPRVRIVHQEHRYSGARGKALEPLRLAADRIALLAVLTHRNEEYLRSDPAFDSTDIEVIPNPIEVGSFAVSPLSQRLILSAGRFVSPKQFDHLVRAFAIATDEHRDWRLRIFGRGPGRATLQTAVRRLGLESRVELPGDTADMKAQLAKASIFALSSRSEALPMVVLEAQSAGLPVVSYDTETGPREIVNHTQGGIIVPQGSINGLAAGIERLIVDPPLRNELGRAARSGAWAFDTEAVMQRWLTLLGSPRPTMPLPAVRSLGASEDALHVSPSPQATRELVVRALQESGAAFRPATPLHNGTWRLAAQREDVTTVLAAISTVDDSDIRIAAFLRGDPLGDPWRSDDRCPLLATAADELRLLDESGEPLGTIEFWTLKSTKLRHRPKPDDGPEWVDEDTWDLWMDRATPTPSGKPYWDAQQFEIDVVYTWVDGNDPEWRARKAPFDRVAHSGSDATRDARFRNRNELLYSVRSVRKYMPWVRNTFIVTDGQIPYGVLDEFPDVVVVDHRDIFPDPSVLPVFNSHAIEASLHRIAGLAEHYIYFNDDVMVARPLTPDHFFHSNGIAKFFPSGAQINYGGQSDMPHLLAGANNRRFMADVCGVELTRGLLHTPHPQRRSVIEELEEGYSDIFEVTRRNRFRSATDYSIASSLAPFFGHATGRYVPAKLGYRYVPLRADALVSRLQRVLDDPTVDVIALGEPTEADRRHRDEYSILTGFLEELVHRRSVPVYVPGFTASIPTIRVTPEHVVGAMSDRLDGPGAGPLLGADDGIPTTTDIEIIESALPRDDD